jgi:hypothetical protein
MRSESIWWQDKFIQTQYQNPMKINFGQTALSFEIFGTEIQIGFVGPYSMAYSDQEVFDPNEIFEVWRKLLQIYSGYKTSIRLPPTDYYPKLVDANIKAIQAFGGYEIYSDINHYLKLELNFMNRVNRNRKRELAELDKNDYEFRDIDLFTAYDVISRNRDYKNLKMTISLERLSNLLKLFPGNINFHGVELHGRVLSSSITMIVNPNLVYVFMWGHDPYIEFSGKTISYLCRELARYYEKQGMVYMCLGTSSILGVEDEGLRKFKMSLGAIETKRPVMMINGIL